MVNNVNHIQNVQHPRDPQFLSHNKTMGDGMETRRRSVVKALVWNAMGLVMMTLVGLVATGSAAIGGGMALVNAAIGLTLYVVYERIWAGIAWGRNV
jgi:uncharacterized membrane protein